MLKKERKSRQKKERKLQKKYQVTLQELQKFVDRDLVNDVSIVRTQKSYESPLILEQQQPILKEINVAVDISDIESIDEVLASGPDKWIAAAAGKEVFDSAVTLDEVSKNPPALFTEDMEISVATDMPSLKHIMDMNDPAIEAFDSGTAMNAPLKNPSSQHTADSETLEKDSICTYELSALSAFDSIDIDFSAYTIDIDAVNQAPVMLSRRKLQLSPFRDLALRNISFGWSRCCINSIDSRISSISICTSVSNVASIISNVTSVSTVTAIECNTIVNIEFCEREQLFCFSVKLSVSSVVECTTESNTKFYGEKQSFCFNVDVVCTFVVVNIDALILIAGLINITKNFV